VDVGDVPGRRGHGHVLPHPTGTEAGSSARSFLAGCPHRRPRSCRWCIARCRGDLTRGGEATAASVDLMLDALR
jgi:hypothetical protein